MKTKIKKIVITQETTEDLNVTTTVKIKGFNDFEVIGLLNYYKDAFIVKTMRSTKKQEPDSEI
jgi:hypothetical protein